VWFDDDLLVVADTGNHRVLIWHGGIPRHDHAEADVVIGQPDMTSEGPKLLHLPTGLLVDDGRLVVCDAWHHRVLVWDRIPETGTEAPDFVIGQPDVDAIAEGCGPDRFYWPFGVALVAGTFWIADTGNRRVLGWHGGIPPPGRRPDVLLGQPSLDHRGENRDGAPAGDSFRWPHAMAGDAEHLYVADAGNHRVLGWCGPLEGDRPAELVLGQPSFTSAREWPYGPQGPSALRFPYGVCTTPGDGLAVADTANNRVLVWDHRPDEESVAPRGDVVLGQPDFDANGENRWSHVGPDTLCWPYGLHAHGGRIAVADSGNNRVVVWRAGGRS